MPNPNKYNPHQGAKQTAKHKLQREAEEAKTKECCGAKEPCCETITERD